MGPEFFKYPFLNYNIVRELVELSILGGIEGKGGNSVFVKGAEDFAFLFDAGYDISNKQFPFPDFHMLTQWLDGPWELEAVHISHAHLDHYGGILQLIDMGFQGPLLMSNLTALFLKHYLSSKEWGTTKDAIILSYIKKLRKQVIQFLTPFPFFTHYPLSNGIHCFQVPADHVPGSSITFIKFSKHNTIIGYTGDLGNDLPPTLSFEIKTFARKRIDVLFFDATNLLRSNHNDVLSQQIKCLIKLVNIAYEKETPILFPVKSLGQAQVIMKHLSATALKNGITYDVFLDGLVYHITKPLMSRFEGIKFLSKMTFNTSKSPSCLIFTTSNKTIYPKKYAQWVTQIQKNHGQVVFTTPHPRDQKNVNTWLDILPCEHLAETMDTSDSIAKKLFWYFPINIHASQARIFEFLNELKPNTAVPIHFNCSSSEKRAIEDLWKRKVDDVPLYFMSIGDVLEI